MVMAKRDLWEKYAEKRGETASLVELSNYYTRREGLVNETIIVPV